VILASISPLVVSGRTGFFQRYLPGERPAPEMPATPRRQGKNPLMPVLSFCLIFENDYHAIGAPWLKMEKFYKFEVAKNTKIRRENIDLFQ
jgi:hypothetical protein